MDATSVSAFTDSLERIGRIIYRFRGIPAVAMEFQSADTAVRLRSQGWVDYIAPARHDLTPDFVSVLCFNGTQQDPPPRGSPQSPQVIPWHIEKIGADDAWAVATGWAPQNQELLVLDDGADEQQSGLPLGPDLDANAYFWYVDPSIDGDGWHGTPVLGAAAARNNSVGTVGVAPDAPIRIAKIADSRGGDDQHWDAWTAIAIDANAPYSRVMTLSYSSKLSSPQPPPSFVTLYDAIQDAYYNHNVVIVASTGNADNPSIYSFPAAFPEVVGVGGSNLFDQHIYNNWAPGNVEVSAPANQVETVCKGGQTGLAAGTSFATPMVAGAFMLLKQHFPTESSAKLRQRLTHTATPMANSQQSGAGRINVDAALNFVYPPPPSATISGPTLVRPGESCLWQSSVSGGAPPFTYYWTRNGGFVGQAPDVTTFFNSSGNLVLQVRDALDQLDIVTLPIIVSSGAQICPI